jgi:hypothetical protein
LLGRVFSRDSFELEQLDAAVKELGTARELVESILEGLNPAEREETSIVVAMSAATG